MRQLADPFDSYDGLIGIIRHRLAELQVTCEATSALAGLTETHISKIVCAKRSRMLGRISFTVLLQALGVRLVAVVDEEAYAPLRARLKPAKFNRWKLEPSDAGEGEATTIERAMKISVDELGGEAVVKGVPELLAAATVPLPKPKEAKRPVFDPAERHPMPARRRPMMFGRGTRKASSAACR
jgi:hypothetical protein